MGKASQRFLISWIGGSDLKAVGVNGSDHQDLGPIMATLREHSFDAVELLFSYPEEQVRPYLKWLRTQLDTPIRAESVSLSSPVNFGEIYVEVDRKLATLDPQEYQLSILLNPGTPAMQAIWVLLGKTRYPARFYQSSVEQGVEEVDIPFELSMEHIPAVKTLGSEKLPSSRKTGSSFIARKCSCQSVKELSSVIYR